MTRTETAEPDWFYDGVPARWARVAAHVVAWPLLLLGAIAGAVLISATLRGYEGFGVEQGLVSLWFAITFIPMGIGAMLVIAATGWRRLLSKSVVAVVVLVLVLAIITSVIGAR